MLDYAANAVIYWPAERLRATLAENLAAQGRDAEAGVRDLISRDGDAEDEVDDPGSDASVVGVLGSGWKRTSRPAGCASSSLPMPSLPSFAA